MMVIDSPSSTNLRRKNARMSDVLALALALLLLGNGCCDDHHGIAKDKVPLMRVRQSEAIATSYSSTLPPTRTPVRTTLDYVREDDISNDIPSEGDNPDNLSNGNNTSDFPTTTTTDSSTTTDEAEKLAIISVSLAGVFSAFVLAVTAFIWRTYRKRVDDATPKLNQDPISILRNGDEAVSIY